MSVLYQYPVQLPGDTSRLARADLMSPYSLDDVHARIDAERYEYEDAIWRLSSRNPRRRAEIVELFFGFVFHSSFVLWRTDSQQRLKLDVALTAVPGGTIITIISDVRNVALSRAWMVIGIGLPALAGFSSAAFIASSWVAALIAGIVMVGGSIYIAFIRKWLVRDFLRAAGDILAIVDPYGRMDNSAPLSGSFLDTSPDS